jgi:DNA-binding transcriptional MocR family regulator
MESPRRSISASQLATLLGDWRRGQERFAHRALAESLRLLILDGRLPLHLWLPGERDLAAALGVSRTTTAAAYAHLRDGGFLTGRSRSAPWTTLPADRATAQPGGYSAPATGNMIDAVHASLPAPIGLHQAVTAAVDELPRHLPGTGYVLLGLPALRSVIADSYTARGLATTPDQVMVTAGAQHGLSLVVRLLTGPGDRVLVEHPTYPNVLHLAAQAGCRPVPVPLAPDGWDIVMTTATMRQSAPRLAYLMPDFHNPTGLLMDTSARQAIAEAAATTQTVVVVDETLVDLALGTTTLPPPMAIHDRHGLVVCLGSTSKSYWGGLRIGWIRARHDLVDRLASFRPVIDLGSAILEQLVVIRLLTEGAESLTIRRAALTRQRDALRSALAEALPAWRFGCPPGGLSLWCELEAPISSALAITAERHRVRIASGTRFGVGGAFERFVRIPFTLPEPELREIAERLALAYAAALGVSTSRPATDTVTVG